MGYHDTVSMPQADIASYFFLVENFLSWFILVYLFSIMCCYLSLINRIKFFLLIDVLTPISRLKVVTF